MGVDSALKNPLLYECARIAVLVHNELIANNFLFYIPQKTKKFRTQDLIKMCLKFFLCLCGCTESGIRRCSVVAGGQSYAARNRYDSGKKAFKTNSNFLFFE